MGHLRRYVPIVPYSHIFTVSQALADCFSLCGNLLELFLHRPQIGQPLHDGGDIAAVS